MQVLLVGCLGSVEGTLGGSRQGTRLKKSFGVHACF